MSTRALVGAVAVSGAAYAALRSHLSGTFRKPVDAGKPTYTFVAYVPHNDSAVIQYTNEREARVMTAAEVIGLGGHPQLDAARRSVGKI